MKAPTIMGLIWDYLLVANIEPERLRWQNEVALFFTSFCRHLLYGIDINAPGNRDASRLGWLPRTHLVVNGLAQAFDAFALVMSPRAPWAMDQFVQKCPGIFAASIKLALKSSHTPDVSRVAYAGEGGRSGRWQSNERVIEPNPILEGLIPRNTKARPRSLSPTKRMPQDLLFPILTKAFVVHRKKDGTERHDRTGEFAATLLLGALRSAEVFHLWVNDLQISKAGKLYGFLRHPGLYIEPGEGSRRDLLSRRYYGLRPRNEARGTTMFAGFKSVALNADHWSTIEWIPNTEDFVRLSFKHYILEVRGPAMEERRKLGHPPHPFLLVFQRSIPHLGIRIGDPYTLSAFRASWGRAIGRLETIVGRSVILAKYAGTTPHAVRHFGGKAWATQTSIENVRKLMRHVSILSSLVYTALDDEEIHIIAEEVSERARNDDWVEDFRYFSSVEEELKRYANSAFAGGARWR
ncbi:hypothetical protein [Rhizobium mongolense]|uniref:Tyr recombinase domain-containing protein n=1 Tax=Rhizobium mongolense TaxID=57676 RepID=A0ABR6ISY3_9HYPH|nr:hypothetical protein [Rhizobium mongolense]MBB4231002.1 hypothetical protein [Rhizobium mongolense]